MCCVLFANTITLSPENNDLNEINQVIVLFNCIIMHGCLSVSTHFPDRAMGISDLSWVR